MSETSQDFLGQIHERCQQHHENGWEGLEITGGHFPSKDVPVCLLISKIGERHTRLFVGSLEKDDESGDDENNDNVLLLLSCELLSLCFFLQFGPRADSIPFVIH